MTEAQRWAASVVIPSRGGCGRIPILFSGLLRQRCEDFEVIVVLDGDVDGSRHVVERYEPTLGERLTIIEFPENRGRVAALNAGFEAASGRVLIRCDDDLEPAPAYVVGHIEAHSGDEPVGAVGLYLNVFEESRYASVYGTPMDIRFREEAYARPTSEHWHYWAGNCSVTRETYDRVGGYDPDYRAYGWEDVDYGRRLYDAGVEVRLVPELETVHHAAAVTTALRMKRAFYSGAAKRIFDSKHPHATADPKVSTAAQNSSVPKPSIPQRAWTRLVDAEASLIGPDSVERIGRSIDAAILAMPGPAAKKLVASGVEAAALAGRRHAGSLDLTF